MAQATSFMMWWFLALGTITLATCKGSPLIKVDLAKPIINFSNDLYKHLGKAENGNMVYSPYSIHAVMALALAGSPEDSDTYKQLTEVLKADKVTSQEFKIDYSLLRSHYREIERKYRVEEECEGPIEVDYDGNLSCDNKPDLDIRTGYRVYTQKGLDVKSDYRIELDTFYRAGKKHSDNPKYRVTQIKISDFKWL